MIYRFTTHRSSFASREHSPTWYVYLLPFYLSHPCFVALRSLSIQTCPPSPPHKTQLLCQDGDADQGGQVIGSCTRTPLADVTLHNNRSRRILYMPHQPLLPTRSYAVPLQVSRSVGGTRTQAYRRLVAQDPSVSTQLGWTVRAQLSDDV